MRNLGLASLRQVAVASDGQRLAYVGLTTRSNLWAQALDPAGSETLGMPRPLTTGNGRNSRPTFSPDGTRIVFDRWQLGVDAGLLNRKRYLSSCSNWTTSSLR